MRKLKVAIGDLSPVYCSACRRFLGYESIKKGYALIYCKNCKAWNVIVGRSTNAEKVDKTVKEFLANLTRVRQANIIEEEAKGS